MVTIPSGLMPARTTLSADAVRLLLVGAAEFCEERAAGGVDRFLTKSAVADAREHAGQRHADVGLLRLLHLLHGVAFDDVTDLVSEHAGNFVHLVGALDESAVHVDEAARHGERVDFLAVDDEEMPVEIAPAGEPGDGVAQHIDVAVQLGIADDGKLGVDLLGFLHSHLNFLLGRNAASCDGGSSCKR